MGFIKNNPLILILSIAVLLSGFYFFFQEFIFLNNGSGWDGVAYVDISNQFKEGVSILGKKPFVFRVLLPFLASLIPMQTLKSFFAINLVVSLANVFLLYYWLKIHTKNKVLLYVFTLFFMTHWLMPFRFNFFYPATCDCVAFFFILILLITLDKLFKHPNKKKYYIIFCLALFIGIFNREFLLIYPFCIFFIKNPIKKLKPFIIDLKSVYPKIKAFLFSFIIAFSIYKLIQSNVTINGNDYNFFHPIRITLFNKSIPEFLLSFFNVYGVFTAILLFFYKEIIKVLFNYQYLIPVVFFGLLIAAFGGGDTERFYIWLSPVIFLFLIKIIENNIKLFKKPYVIAFIAVTLIFTLRIFAPIPQPYNIDQTFSFPLLTTLKQGDFLNGLAYYANEKFVIAALLEYIFLSILLIIYFIKKTKKVIIINGLKRTT